MWLAYSYSILRCQVIAMKNLLFSLYDKFLDKSLDFRVRLFNVLALAGTLIGALMAVLGLVNHGGLANVVINIGGAVLAYILLCYSYRTGRYHRCYLITIVAIFLIMFPALFFSSGGYHSGMPCFFVFAVLFTVFMLEGWLVLLMCALELLVYTGICLIANFYPQTVRLFVSEADLLTDIIVAFITVSAALGITMFLHFRLYNEQQRQLEIARQEALDAQQLLMERNAALEQLNRRKTEFLGNVSHEFKTPLTVMLGVAQNTRRVLENRDAADELVPEMKLLASEIDRLGLMVTQILDATRIEENSMIWNMEECSIEEIIQTTIATYYPMLKKNNNRLAARPGGDLPAVCADPQRISQVLVNLMQNAIRHTHGGNITIAAKQDGAFVQVSVADTGEGIEPEYLPHIFERYKSHSGGKKAHGRRDTGTGLGLFICKHIVENHGGEITAMSEIGQGTTVSFTIPVHPRGGQTHTPVSV